MSVFQDLWEEKEYYIYDLSFWRATLLYMQADQGNESTECVTTYDTYVSMMANITTNVATDANYLSGLAQKGQGTGSEVGFIIDKGQKYLDLLIYGVNVFNYCDFNLYLQSTGKALGSSSGFVNQLINLGFRFFSDEDALVYYDMSVAMMSRNVELVGNGFGKFLKAFFSVEVPDTTSVADYQSVG